MKESAVSVKKLQQRGEIKRIGASDIAKKTSKDGSKRRKLDYSRN